MAQIFHPSTNTLAKASIFGAVFILAAGAWIAAGINRSSYVTGVNVIRDQPVPFSHEHHVRGLGIDCRYCHTSVEDSSFAGMPSTKTCMTCHSQIWTDAEVLEPVRESWRTNQPLRWTRVYDLADHVYFNHAIHVQKGVGCVTCHGQVDTMPLTWKAVSLHMEWCLECHRNPEPFLRPREEIFSMNWTAADPFSLDGSTVGARQASPFAEAEEGEAGLAPTLSGRQLMKEHNINVTGLTNCSICHR